MKVPLNILLFLILAGSLRAQEQDSLPVVDEVTRATVRADSVAKAELAHYQQEHHGRDDEERERKPCQPLPHGRYPMGPENRESR